MMVRLHGKPNDLTHFRINLFYTLIAKQWNPVAHMVMVPTVIIIIIVDVVVVIPPLRFTFKTLLLFCVLKIYADPCTVYVSFVMFSPYKWVTMSLFNIKILEYVLSLYWLAKLIWAPILLIWKERLSTKQCGTQIVLCLNWCYPQMKSVQCAIFHRTYPTQWVEWLV